MPDVIQLTRRQVARQEIETAIDLLFTHGSLAVANLLAWAALDVLKGVAKNQNTLTFHALMEDKIKDEFLSKWRNILREHYNYCKHSDRDPDKQIDNFKADIVHLALFASIADYGEIYKQLTLPMYLFRGWFLAKNPQFLREDAVGIAIPDQATILGKGAPFAVAAAIYLQLKNNRALAETLVPEERRSTTEF